MTLVPNLQQRLNGSNRTRFALWAMLCIVFSLSFSACDLFKKVPTSPNSKPQNEEFGEIQGGKTYDPTTGEEVIVKKIPGNLDTVEFKTNPTDKYPPIVSEGSSPEDVNNTGSTNAESILKSSYNVTMMLPFVTNKFNAGDADIYERSKWALHYYGGTKMAFDMLESEGISLNINMLDTEGNPSTVAQQLVNDEALQNADVIIGPYRSNNIRQVAKYGKDKQKVVISPYSAASRLTDDNPYFVQVNPSLETHCQAITKHILASHNADEVVLVVRDKPEEVARLAYFQDAHRNIKGDVNAPRFKEFLVEESTGYVDINIDEVMNKGRTTVFVVPSWSNEVFVSSLLRQINIAKKTYDRVIVYGMPQWMEFEKIDYAYYEQLKLHVSSSFYINRYAETTRNFRQRFYNRYGKLPNKEAYLGYDVALYFGRMLKQHGTKFQEQMAAQVTPMLHSEFDFQAVKDPSVVTDVSKIPTERYENRYVHILKFQEYHFQPSN